MGEDEHVVVVRRVVSPPTLPLLIPPVPAAHGPEHVAAHHAGADVLERLLPDRRALVHLAAVLVMRLAPGGQRHGPVMQSLSTLAERVLLALVPAGDESVCRDRDVTPELAHRASSVGGRFDRGTDMTVFLSTRLHLRQQIGLGPKTHRGTTLKQMLKQRPELEVVFHALADPSRRSIVERLSLGSATVT